MTTPGSRDLFADDVPAAHGLADGPDLHGSVAVDPVQTGVGPGDDRSLGELVALATADMSTLIRKEVQLAKVELKKEATAAGKGAGALIGAAVAGVLALLFLLIALAFALGRIINLGSGFLFVGLLLLAVAAVAAVIGRKNLKKVGPPERTIETVKDDIAFAKSPTTTPARRAD